VGDLRNDVGRYAKRCFGLATLNGHTFMPALIGRGALVVDLGCNRGDFAEPFLTRFPCRYYALDANPALVDVAAARLGVAVEHMAVSNLDGEAEFYLSGNPEASSLYSAIAALKKGDGVLRVPAMTYGSWSRRHNIGSVSLLKVDIEGAELDLFETWDGAVARPEQVTVEFHDFIDEAQLPRVRQCIAKLQSLGYVYLNSTFPDHIDCLFVDKLRLRGWRGLLTRSGWKLLTTLYRLRGSLQGSYRHRYPLEP
jgi:FkbM family methyltransferase